MLGSYENRTSPLLRKRKKPVTTDSNHKLKPSFDRQGYAKHDPERGQTCWNRSSTARRLMLFALSAMQSIACRVIGGRHYLYRHPLSLIALQSTVGQWTRVGFIWLA